MEAIDLLITSSGLPKSPEESVGFLFNQARSHKQERFRLVETVRAGIPGDAVKKYIELVGLTVRDLSDATRIPERTMARRLKEDRLPPADSESVLRLAGMIFQAEGVFGDRASALAWLRRPNRTLSGQTPWQLLDTTFGAREVEDALVRIEHGVFA